LESRELLLVIVPCTTSYMPEDDKIEELKGLVLQTLESKGVLQKIRAQLRASVFTAVKEQPLPVGAQPAAPVGGQTGSGALMRELVLEYLAFNGMGYTRDVFMCEGNCAADGHTQGQEQLGARVGLDKPAVDKPVLGDCPRAPGRSFAQCTWPVNLTQGRTANHATSLHAGSLAGRGRAPQQRWRGGGGVQQPGGVTPAHQSGGKQFKAPARAACWCAGPRRACNHGGGARRELGQPGWQAAGHDRR
jgi:hypothetical protein